MNERKLSRHSSRLSRTSLCDFYTRSDFLAARLALARQIYVPQPYKSRAYKDIEAKANENSSSHPLRAHPACLFPPLLRRPLGTPSSSLPPYLVYPSSSSTDPLLPTTTAFPPSPVKEPSNENKNTKSRRASPITGSVSLSSSRSPPPPSPRPANLTCLIHIDMPTIGNPINCCLIAPPLCDTHFAGSCFRDEEKDVSAAFPRLIVG